MLTHKPRLFISFSGGETSALMTRLLLTRWRDRYGEVVVLFANTGQESEQTLEFVRDCDKHFGFGTVWVEAVTHPEARRGTTHRVVDFETASRDGRPFEDSIRKYGIANTKFPHCTRELKLRPMTSYLRSVGWLRGGYDVAVGIRADEAKRRSPTAAASRIVYPLMDWEPLGKPDVNSFWAEQPFRLNLPGYRGNCKWCWKKSLRKHMTIMDDDPAIFDFPARMEALYGRVGPEFNKRRPADPEYRRTFFRGGLSAADLRAIYADQFDVMDRAENDAVVYSGRRIDLDVEPSDGSCTESCEVNFEFGDDHTALDIFG